MKETTDYRENIVDIVHACRKKNKNIGARQKHFYSNSNTIRIQLSGHGQIDIPVVIAENGVSQMTNEALQRIVDTFEVK